MKKQMKVSNILRRGGKKSKGFKRGTAGAVKVDGTQKLGVIWPALL
jgi:hypothetical protein